jgi:cellulose biosynthesis protein BcsQ
MAKKIVIHSPKGGQGKTTITANIAIMLADREKKVLVIDACDSKGLQLYFNVSADHGIADLLSGAPLDDLIGEIRPNLYFLPLGDPAEIEYLLVREKLSYYSKLEKALQPADRKFDFILFDTAPSETTRLFYSIMFYVDRVLTPIETKRAGFDKIVHFRDLLKEVNPVLRTKEKKKPLKINRLVPYWFGRANSRHDILEMLRDEFKNVVTDPIGECDALHTAWSRADSLEHFLQNVTPRPNEERALNVFNNLLQSVSAS